MRAQCASRVVLPNPAEAHTRTGSASSSSASESSSRGLGRKRSGSAGMTVLAAETCTVPSLPRVCASRSRVPVDRNGGPAHLADTICGSDQSRCHFLTQRASRPPLARACGWTFQSAAISAFGNAPAKVSQNTLFRAVSSATLHRQQFTALPHNASGCGEPGDGGARIDSCGEHLTQIDPADQETVAASRPGRRAERPPARTARPRGRSTPRSCCAVADGLRRIRPVAEPHDRRPFRLLRVAQAAAARHSVPAWPHRDPESLEVRPSPHQELTAKTDKEQACRAPW